MDHSRGTTRPRQGEHHVVDDCHGVYRASQVGEVVPDFLLAELKNSKLALRFVSTWIV